MIGERIRAIRCYKFQKLSPLLLRKAGADANMLQCSGFIKQPQQQGTDGFALGILVPPEPGHDTVAIALVLHLEHDPLARLVPAIHRLQPPSTHRHPPASPSLRPAPRLQSDETNPTPQLSLASPVSDAAEQRQIETALPAAHAAAEKPRRISHRLPRQAGRSIQKMMASAAPAVSRAKRPDECAVAAHRSRARHSSR